ncbi:MAG: SagB/ThcOx family dehydrogenase [Bacillota bacterium]|jgi:SagB-type dehydrogenase family enzyme|nr:SagB/ThcOx family dehydrogenase [Bacillota bacterium]
MSTGREFMEKTKYKHLKESDQVQGLPQPSLADGIEEGAKVIDLPAPESFKVRKVDLSEAIVTRTSIRNYSSKPYTLEELAYLLYMTQGVKEVTTRPATLRTVPSAGSRHPVETYVLCNRVEGLKPAIYRYAALDHKLVEVNTGAGLDDKVTAGLYGQQMVKHSAVTFMWVAVAYRSMWRYTERAYRYMHLDAGHVCQNLYLAVQGIGAGCCGIAAFRDDEINAVLGVDGVERFMIYAATTGKLD